MARMVRKQIYIRRRQEAALKKVARCRGLSEAEIIREALDGRIDGSRAGAAPADPSAWAQALAFMRRLQRGQPRKSRQPRWRREDLYEERLSRYGRSPR